MNTDVLAPGDWVEGPDGLRGRVVFAGGAAPDPDWAGHGPSAVGVETSEAGLVVYPDRGGLRRVAMDRGEAAMAARFGQVAPCRSLAGMTAEQAAAFDALLDRRACRRFRAEPVPEGLMRLVLAAGFAAPSKSDLQQADVVRVRDPAIRAEVTRDCGDWLAGAPAEVEILVVCGDGRRLRRLYGPGEDDWPNDHFDALFNATGDAAILLGALVTAATLAGLGACPVSVMRNRAEAVAGALALPERVFPFAGLAIGWEAEPRAPISPRLGPAGALHIDRFDTQGQDAAVAAYDARRGPVGKGASWTDAKRHQYATPQRTGWGAFLRACGFRMD